MARLLVYSLGEVRRRRGRNLVRFVSLAPLGQAPSYHDALLLLAANGGPRIVADVCLLNLSPRWVVEVEALVHALLFLLDQRRHEILRSAGELHHLALAGLLGLVKRALFWSELV